ncbi:MAG: TetR/AcrR family transcriptional regulator [Spirochaetes bacterium]|nr:TetR/AcrR family transcriptional regulator [Spirochaetota bacterium]
MAEKQKYHHGNLRKSLIKAGLEHIESGRTEILSLRSLARELGVSKNAPYRHFKNRSYLIKAIADEGFSMLYDSMTENLTGIEDVKEKLSLIGLGYVRFSLKHPGLYRMMFAAAGSVKCSMSKAELESQSNLPPTFLLLSDTIKEGIEAGIFTHLGLKEATIAAWAFVHGLSSLINDSMALGFPGLDLTDEAIFRSIETVLFTGL